MKDDHLDRAVAPTLFDAFVDPALAFTLVFANLMSPRLWELRERSLHFSPPGPPQPEGLIEHIQQVLDHHYEHVTPARVAELNGVFDLDAVAARYGAEMIDYARSTILSSLERRVARGTVQKEALALDLMQQNRFPAYTYATVDEAWASRRLLGRRKHKPLGLTCCLDEAALFTALLLTLPKGSVGDLAFLGSPTHYTVLAWTGEGAWWFYSKHVLQTRRSWASLVADTYVGDFQLAFDDRLPDFDRITTPSGIYQFRTGETTIAEPRLAALVSGLDGFFGFRPAQLELALARALRPVAAADLRAIVDDVSAASCAAEVQAHIRRQALEEGHPEALRALYAFRTLQVPEPSVYLRAARNRRRIGDVLPRIETAEEALRYVAAIEGTSSIFEDPDRIAMPDETVRFRTGTDRDKALLLHLLLEQALGAGDPARTGLETLLGDADSFVRSDRFCVSLSRGEYVPRPEGQVRYRIGAPPDG
jgi:hypothetical protein